MTAVFDQFQALAFFQEAGMERRKIANETEARWALAEVARAGMRIREWARANGVDGRSLHAWDLVLARRGASPTPARHALVELVPTSAQAGASGYVIRVGDVSLEFGDDAREETLRRVLMVMRSC